MADSELRRRVITGACIGAIIIGALVAGVIPAALLVMLIIIGSSAEYFRISRSISSQIGSDPYSFLCGLPLIPIFANLMLDATGSSAIDWGVFAISLALVLILYFLVRIKADVHSLTAGLKTVGVGLMLFTIPGASALFICGINTQLLLGVFLLIWSSDIFAYFGGKAFGRHKLLESISPKKTWEGFFSGLIASGLMAWGLSYFITELDAQHWIITGLLVAIFGTLGDLLQSTFKRAAGVKDSGNVLPGHGGIWDRFDSFLGCMPWVGMYYLMM